MKKIKYFLDGLTMKQLLLLSQRYDMTPVYKNPQKRRRALFFQIKKYLEKQEIECAICLESIKYNTIIATPCAHLFCDSCLIRHIKNSEKCPICRVSCPYTYVVDHIFYDRIPVLNKIIETDTIEDEEAHEYEESEQSEQETHYIEQLFIAIQLQQFEQLDRQHGITIMTNYYCRIKWFIKSVIRVMMSLIVVVEVISIICISICYIGTAISKAIGTAIGTE